jgi:hypothetical protein
MRALRSVRLQIEDSILDALSGWRRRFGAQDSELQKNWIAHRVCGIAGVRLPVRFAPTEDF